MALTVWGDLAAAGAVGLGIGLGLVVGTLAARAVRSYLDRDENH